MRLENGPGNEPKIGILWEGRFLRFWFPLFLYSGIIFYVSSWPNVSAPESWPHLDKIAHIIEYLPFGILTARALTNAGPRLGKKGVYFFVLLITCMYALSDEWHQSFVPGRESSFFDAAADLIGSMVGVFVYTLITKRNH